MVLAALAPPPAPYGQTRRPANYFVTSHRHDVWRRPHAPRPEEMERAAAIWPGWVTTAQTKSIPAATTVAPQTHRRTRRMFVCIEFAAMLAENLAQVGPGCQGKDARTVAGRGWGAAARVGRRRARCPADRARRRFLQEPCLGSGSVSSHKRTLGCSGGREPE